MGSRLLLAAIGVDDHALVRDANRVFFQRSDDSGLSWDHRSYVTRAGRNPAHQLTLLLSPQGVLHLVWHEDKSTASLVIHAESRDQGLTWSAPDEFAAPGLVDGLRAALDRCGQVHVVFEDWVGGADSLHLDHAVWSGSWSHHEHLFSGLLTSDPALGLRPDSTLVLVFLWQTSPRREQAIARSMMAEWRSDSPALFGSFAPQHALQKRSRTIR
jgi:hypothetical protein